MHTQLILASVAIAFVLVSLVLRFALVSKRARGVRAFAAEWGFHYEPYGRGVVRRVFAACPLMQGGRGNAAQNLMQGRLGGHDAYFFDWLKVTGWERAGEVRKQTCCALVSTAGLGLPPFVLYAGRGRPKHWHIEGMETVALPTDLGYGARMWLQTPSPEKVSPLFDGELAAFLDRRYPLHIECTGSVLLMYQPNETVAPRDYRQMRTHLERLWQLLTRASPHQAPRDHEAAKTSSA